MMSTETTTDKGRLIRRVPTRLLDVSLSGCLLETEREVQVGTPGLLHVELWGVACRYPLRVTRVFTAKDGGRARVAAEFTWGEESSNREERVDERPGPRPVRPPARILAFDRGGRVPGEDDPGPVAG